MPGEFLIYYLTAAPGYGFDFISDASADYETIVAFKYSLVRPRCCAADIEALLFRRVYVQAVQHHAGIDDETMFAGGIGIA